MNGPEMGTRSVGTSAQVPTFCPRCDGLTKVVWCKVVCAKCGALVMSCNES